MAMEHVQSGFFEGKSLQQLEEEVLWELGQVIGTTASYDKFPQAKIREKLNDRQNKFCFKTHCLRKFALIVGKEDYRQYRLPLNTMEGGVIAVKYYTDSDTYVSLDPVDIEFMNQNLDGYLIDGSTTPQYAFQGYSLGNIPMLEVHPPPNADGDTYVLATDTGIAIGGDLPATSSNVTGIATGGTNLTLVDAGVDFTTLGLAAGMYVRNVTDASYAYIQTIAANTLTFAAALTGGTANTFSAGDSYNILAGEYGVLTAWEDDDRYVFSSEVGLTAKITVPAGNFRVDYVPYPLQIMADSPPTMKPEIPKLYHTDLAMAVVADFLRTFHENTQEFQRAEAYEAVWQAAIESASRIKESQPFKNKPVNIRPRLR